MTRADESHGTWHPRRLVGRVAVVTGGASGIGRAMCERFATEGAQRGRWSTSTRAGRRRGAVGGRDVPQGRRDLRRRGRGDVRGGRRRFGGIDVCCNNAGISPPDDDSILETGLEAWERVQRVNLTSVYLCCKHALPHLLARGSGSIVNTASFVAVMGAATSQISYTASKGGVLALSRELGVQFARQGVRVNALCPGPVNTPLLQELFAKDPERAARRLVHIPMGRFGEAAEIAAAAAFLASDDSSFVTASTFLVDGGISAAYVTPSVGTAPTCLAVGRRASGRVVGVVVAAPRGARWGRAGDCRGALGDDPKKGGENVWISRMSIDLAWPEAQPVSSSETKARRTSSEHRKVGAREAGREAARRHGGWPRECCKAGSRDRHRAPQGDRGRSGWRIRTDDGPWCVTVASLEPPDRLGRGLSDTIPARGQRAVVRRSPEEHGRLRPNGYSGLRRVRAHRVTPDGRRRARVRRRAQREGRAQQARPGARPGHLAVQLRLDQREVVGVGHADAAPAGRQHA